MKAVLLRSATFALLACAAFASSLAYADAPGTDVAEITFDKTPQMRGMGYDGYGVKYARVHLTSGDYDAWMAERSLDGNRQWERTWRLKVNDPRMFEGKRPVVDIDITYHLPGWGSVEVFAAAAGGKVQHVGGGWGNSTDWKTMHLQLDDACFSNAEKGEQLGPFDLRISGSNAPVYLKQVRLTFYNPTDNVHWDRMLQIRDFAGETPGGVLAFTQQPGAIKLNLGNLAFIDRPVRYHFDIDDANGHELQTVDQTVTVKAKDATAIRLPFDATHLPLGPYRGNFQVFVGDKAVLSMPLRLGVISSTVLDKARDNEFFYGIDPANSQIYPIDTETAAAYYRLMGIDFLRRVPVSGAPSTESIQKGIDFLQHENLRAMFGEDPPRPNGQGIVDAKQVAHSAAILEEAIKAHGGRAPGHIPFVELGNEPDLSSFWPGDIKLYNDNMNVFADHAIAGRTLAGLKSSDCLIGNGGLSFAGTEGDRRSRELLKMFDPTKLDIIEYHGHGPGIEAERSAYERLERARAKTNVNHLPAMETESGMSASSEPGLLDQARTAVEKMVYGQSVKLPGFVFFRLFMEGDGTEGGYGMTDHLIQPRPSVLSYRNMVERLRHRRFVRTLDAAGVAGVSGVDLYLFEEIDASGQPTGSKTIVGFSENTTLSQMAIRLDAPNAAVQTPTLFDMFGNTKPLTQLPGNVALMPIGRDSTFLTWKSAGPSDQVAIIPSLLAVQTPDALLEGSDTSGVLVVRNPGPRPMNATLALDATGSPAISVTPASQNMTIAPFGQMQVPLSFHVDAPTGPLELPRWWRVYPDADPEVLKGADWTTLPQELKKRGGGTSTGQQMFTADNRLEFTKLFGNPSEHRPVVALAYIDSPRDAVLPAAASADWWMDWYANGKLIYSTATVGNLGGNLADHTFNIPLKAGRNLIAFHCGSGSQGWSMKFGGPRERQLAVPGLPPLDRVHVSLRADGQTLADVVVPLTLQEAIAPLGTMADPANAENWRSIEPFCVLDADAVHNLFYKEPDASKWYHGPDDLSAMIWVRDDRVHGALHLAVAVKDDKHVPAKQGEPLDQHDSLRCVLAGDDGHSLADLILVADSMASDRNTGVATSATRDERAVGGPTTYYHVVVPEALISQRPFRLSLRVADDDGFGLKQTAEIGEVSMPIRGIRLHLP